MKTKILLIIALIILLVGCTESNIQPQEQSYTVVCEIQENKEVKQLPMENKM